MTAEWKTQGNSEKTKTPGQRFPRADGLGCCHCEGNLAFLRLTIHYLD